MDRIEALAIIDRAKKLGLFKKKFLDDNFPKQSAFVADPSRFIVARCSRRAGKSTALALRFFQTLESHPGAFCPYIALTRESAKNIMWTILQEIDERFHVGCEFTESNLTMTHPNGARLQLFGADMQNFIRRLKGIKTPGAAVDEVQDLGDHLQSLVDDVLTPTLTDYDDSWLALTGTPGAVPQGYFYEITEQKKYGYSFHSWTLFDNPYLPKARKFIDDIKAKRGWDENNPTLRREWYNEWVLDQNSLLIRYNPEINDYSELPKGNYRYVLGVDFGIRDADALALVAWSDDSPNIYLVDELITAGQGITEVVQQIQLFQSRYEISKIVVDQSALGAKISEEIRRRYAIPLHPADQKRKMENIALLNDYLRLGKFKAKKGSRFVKDSYRVEIDWERSTPNRIAEKKSFHSDALSATTYAFKESTAWTHRPPPPPTPKVGSKEWLQIEEEKMWEMELEAFRQRESKENWDFAFI